MKDMGKVGCVGVALFSAAAAFAEATTLSGNTYRIQDSADATYTVSSVFEGKAWPAGLPTPIFRFDCQQTNDWEFTTDAKGRLCVTKIPSLVGDGRFLTTDQTLAGTSFKTWTLKKPLFLNPDDELNAPALDFCDGKSLNSQIGMIFDPVQVTADDTAKTNTLENIGTVIAVYGSQLGGGSFLGGGYNPLSPTSGSNGKLWSRARNNMLTTKNADTSWVDFPCPVSGATTAQSYGRIRHFGLPSTPNECGFTGGWEVFTYAPTNNNLSATGVGLGDCSPYYHSGGMRIAEMIFFHELLTADEMSKVERYLARKWFNREESEGYNGRTTLGWYRQAGKPNASASMTTTFDIPAGETLHLDRLQGGRKRGTVGAQVIKRGEGTLEVGDFAKYSGTLVAEGGTLQFPGRAIPTTNELPAGAYVWIDASDSRCLDLVKGEDGTNYVAGLLNLANGTYKDKAVSFRQSNVSLRPWLRPNEVGARAVVDFGYNADGTTKRIMRFTDGTSSDSYTGRTMPPVYTVVAILGAPNGGGHFLNGMYQRHTRWPGSMTPWTTNNGNGTYNSYWKSGLLERENTFGYYGKLNAVEGTAFVNGRKLDAPTTGYETTGYQTAAWRVPGYGVSYLGGEDPGTTCGRFRLGEVLMYLRPLSDEEIRDVQAYLAKKWLGRTLAGYCDDAKNGVAQIQDLKVTGKTTIDVPAGTSARIGKVSLEADLVKSGAGTLYVADAGSAQYNLVVKGGAVKVLEPQITNQCQMAANPSLHLDAAAINHMILWPKDGTNFVYRWFDEGNNNCAFQIASTVTAHPWLNTTDTLNGLPCIDCGKPSYVWGRAYAYLELDRMCDGVRSVFVVCGAQNGGNQLFGCSNSDGSDSVFSDDASWGSDWYIEDDNTKRTGILAYNANANIRDGEIYVDGVLTNRTAAPMGWSLQEYHTLGGVHISSLNMRCQGTYNRGGNRYCEVIVYERELSEREKVATRNYLTKKWFPARELAALPEAVPETLAPVKSVKADADEETTVDTAVTEVRTLEGAGVIAKVGDTTLKVHDLSGFEGTLDVREGAVEFTLPPATNDTTLIEAGRILHFDAQDADSLTHATEASTGSNVISRWASQVGDLYAIPLRHPDNGAVTNMPFYLAHDLNGHPIINMYTENGWNTRKCSMGFVDANGAAVNVSKIRTAFWVLGSQEGGGLLFGGGNTNGVNVLWFRNTNTGSGQDSGGDYRQGLIGYLTACYWPCLSVADYWVNDYHLPNYGTAKVLSGGYDLVALRLQDGVADDKTPNADGLAMWDMDVNRRNYRGHQRLGEIIAYDRVLTDAEMVQMYAYLQAKWGYTQASPVNDAAINLAAGATLVTTGNQYVAALTGTGTVEGDVTVKNFVVDVTDEASFAVAGTLGIAANPVFNVANVTSGAYAEITVATAAGFAGVENLKQATFVGAPEGVRLRAKVKNGKLVLSIGIRGLKVFVR